MPPLRWICLASACSALLALLLGCMSFSIERPQQVQFVGPVQGGEPLDQTGKLSVPPHGKEMLVYYPVPYVSHPNLTIAECESGGFKKVRISQQTPTSFTVVNDGLFDRDITWISRGVSILAKPAPPPAMMPGAGPPPLAPPGPLPGPPPGAADLPPVPIPVEGKEAPRGPGGAR